MGSADFRTYWAGGSRRCNATHFRKRNSDSEEIEQTWTVRFYCETFRAWRKSKTIPSGAPFKEALVRVFFYALMRMRTLLRVRARSEQCILLSSFIGSKQNVGWAFSPTILDSSGRKWVKKQVSNWTKTVFYWTQISKMSPRTWYGVA